MSTNSGHIIVTGAAGFIGSHICHELVTRGHNVIGIDDESGGSGILNIIERQPDFETTKEACLPDSFQYMKEDCVFAFKRKELLSKDCSGDTLVHCAANAREGASQFQPRAVTYRNMYAYAVMLSEFLRRGGKRVVLFSSMAVYGDQTPPFDETMPRRPEDIYGVNKAAMEHMTEILAEVHNFDYVIIRPHNVGGEGQALHDKFRNVMGIFMNRIMRKEPLFIYGNGLQTRAFSYILDSLPCFIKCIEDLRSVNGEIINIGGMHPITVAYLAATVKEAMGVPNTYPVEFFPARPREVKYAFSTYEKSVRLLGYNEDTYGWENGVRRMALWAGKKGPQEWKNTDVLELVNEKTPKPWLTK